MIFSVLTATCCIKYGLQGTGFLKGVKGILRLCYRKEVCNGDARCSA
jgi:hypothetical protein